MKIADGSYMARAVNIEAVKSGTGTPGVTVTFTILDEGPYKDQMIEWTGWTNDNCKVRTAESLALCGFNGVDPKTISKDIVQIVVEEETYVKDQGLPTEKTYKNSKVRWVNDPGRGRTQFTPVSAAEKTEMFAGLRGLILDQTKVIAEARAKAATGAPETKSNNFDFGANAQPPAAPAASAATEPSKKAMF
jgi:hypothetical protein